MGAKPERLNCKALIAKAAKPRVRRSKSSGVQPSGFKPTRIPDGFVLVVDTREQQPLFIGTHPNLPIIRHALPDGDYAVQGYETQIVFERKKLSDFLSYVGKERKAKTEPKLARLSQARFAALVVEEDEPKLAGPFKYSHLTREHVRAFLLSCRARHGIHVYINKDRESLERFVLDHAIKAWLILQAEATAPAMPPTTTPR